MPRKRLIVPLQAATVGFGARGYQSSAPLLTGFVIDTILIESGTANPLVFANFGYSAGVVTSQAEAQGATSIIDPFGSSAAAGASRAIPIPNGSVYLTELAVLSPSAGLRLWLEVINGMAAGSVIVNAVFFGMLLSEGEYQSYVEGIMPGVITIRQSPGLTITRDEPKPP